MLRVKHLTVWSKPMRFWSMPNMSATATGRRADIEVQGAKQVYAKMPDAIMIFLVPPSLRELKNRLCGRGTDSEEKIRGRLERALAEYSEAQNAGFYQYIIINDDPEVAALEMDAILTAEQCRFSERKSILSEV